MEDNTTWIKLYRKVIHSKIWESKPSSWITIWIYILLKVSFTDNNAYKQGEAHFSSVESEELPFDITNRVWYSCLNWLEKEGMIERKRVWRGSIIRVKKYDRYQGVKTREKQSENEVKHTKQVNIRVKGTSKKAKIKTQKTQKDDRGENEVKITSSKANRNAGFTHPKECKEIKNKEYIKDSGLKSAGSNSSLKGKSIKNKNTSAEARELTQFFYKTLCPDLPSEVVMWEKEIRSMKLLLKRVNGKKVKAYIEAIKNCKEFYCLNCRTPTYLYSNFQHIYEELYKK